MLGYGGLGWHWYLGLASTLLALVVVLFPFVPKSARFYLVKESMAKQVKSGKAEKVIEKVPKMNFMEAFSGSLVSQEEKERSGS